MQLPNSIKEYILYARQEGKLKQEHYQNTAYNHHDDYEKGQD